MKRCSMHPPEIEPAVGASMEQWVMVAGAACAAFIVGGRRKQLHRAGVVDFVIRSDQDTPPWFRVGAEALSRRPKWSVECFDRLGFERCYRVKWLEWRRYA